MNKIIVSGCLLVLILFLCKQETTKAQSNALCYDCAFPCNKTKNIKEIDVVNCDSKFCGQYIADDGDILMAFCVPQRYNKRGTFCEFHSWEEQIQRCHCVGDLCNGKKNFNTSLTENDMHREEEDQI